MFIPYLSKLLCLYYTLYFNLSAYYYARITCYKLVCIYIYIVKIHQWFTYTDLHIHFLSSLFNPVGALRPTGSPYVDLPSFLHFCFLSSPLLFSISSARVWRNCGRTNEANVGRSTYRQKYVLIVTSAKYTL